MTHVIVCVAFIVLINLLSYGSMTFHSARLDPIELSARVSSTSFHMILGSCLKSDIPSLSVGKHSIKERVIE